MRLTSLKVHVEMDGTGSGASGWWHGPTTMLKFGNFSELEAKHTASLDL